MTQEARQFIEEPQPHELSMAEIIKTNPGKIVVVELTQFEDTTPTAGLVVQSFEPKDKYTRVSIDPTKRYAIFKPVPNKEQIN